MLTSPASPSPSQRPVSASASRATGSPAAADARTASIPARPAVDRPTGTTQQRDRADLRLEAADRAATTAAAGRVDRHVPDLAAVPGDAGDRPDRRR